MLIRIAILTGPEPYSSLLNFKNMKNLKTKVLQLGVKNFLSREQLKNVLGGAASSCNVLYSPCRNNFDCCLFCCVEDGEGLVCEYPDQCS